MNCQECARAKVNPTLHDYANRCEGCIARALAATGAHIESEERGALTPQYREALEKLFGDGWAKAHERVKDWASRIRASAANARTAATTGKTQ